MDDGKTMKESLDDLTTMFMQRMESFENQLAKTPEKTPTLEVLSAEFKNFKVFMLRSLHTISSQLEAVVSLVDQQEMRGRRKILLLHGLVESPSEDTSAVVVKAVVERLKLASFTAADISRCHRMGRASADKPRPVLCKFREVSIRDKAWAAKTCLKGTGITVSEFLTKARHEVFIAARQRFGIKGCWTREGTVVVLGGDGVRHRVNTLKDLNEIQQVAPAKSSTSRDKPTAAPAQKRATSRARPVKK